MVCRRKLSRCCDLRDRRRRCQRTGWNQDRIVGTALAVAPLATEARIPEIVVGAVASIITARSPYIVRTMYAQTQVTIAMAQWAAKNGIKRVVTLVSDYSPGLDAEKAFIDEFKAHGGEIMEA